FSIFERAYRGPSGVVVRLDCLRIPGSAVPLHGRLPLLRRTLSRQPAWVEHGFPGPTDPQHHPASRHSSGRVSGDVSSPCRQRFRSGWGAFRVGDEGGDLRAGTAMTTPEVLRSTRLRSRSAVRTSTSTPVRSIRPEGGGVGCCCQPRHPRQGDAARGGFFLRTILT
ncbi:unnamed protein product, partial [Ectocarpus fasciculatus]